MLDMADAATRSSKLHFINDICNTCLSFGRRMKTFDSIPRSISKILKEDFKLNLKKTQKICWECEAVLKKIIHFRNRIIEAQCILKSQTLQIGTLQPLSTLRACHTVVEVTIQEHAGLATSDLDDVKVNIKEEFNDLDASNDLQVYIEKKIKESFTKESEVENANCSGGLEETVNADLPDSKSFKKESESEVENANWSDGIKLTVNADLTDLKSFKKESESQGDEALKANFSRTVKEKQFRISIMNEEEYSKCREIDRIQYLTYKTQYKCHKCLRKFYFKRMFLDHMWRHNEAYGPFVCGVCGIRFKMPRRCEKHTKRHYFKYHCKQCEFSHHQLQRMTVHIDENHNEDVHQCKICQQQFLFRRALNRHNSEKHLVSAVHQCSFCSNTYQSKSLLRDHMRKHELEKTNCHLCNKKVKFMTKHMRNCHDKKEYYCVECDKTFGNNACYRRHLKSSKRHCDPEMLRKHGLEKTNCHLCNKKVKYMRNHMRNCHHKKEYYCVECDKTFGNNAYYRRHLKSSKRHCDPEMLRYVICDYCNKRFSRKRNVESHICRMHLKVNPYKCSVCSKGYTSYCNMVRHVREEHEHQAINPKPMKKHICGDCSKSFLTPAALTIHRRSHTGERPFTCELCFRGFTQKSALKTHHKLVHLKQKLKGRRPRTSSPFVIPIEEEDS